MAIWLEAISVAWMLQVTSTMALPSCDQPLLLGGIEPARIGQPAGDASSSGRASRRFASEEITAINMSSPRVVFPSTSTATRGEPAARWRK